MRTNIGVFLVVAALAAGAGTLLFAQDAPSGKVRQAPSVDKSAPTQGKVLVLHSERAMEGDIERVGDQYRIRRGAAESWVAADKALRLCANWEEAYAYFKTRSNMGDPDERLRLALWCQVNGLRDLALMEARYALEMRPGHTETRKLVTALERTTATTSAAAPKSPASSSTFETAPAAVDVSSDSHALFATKVQPILMNTCVHCHSGGRGGHFQLIRTYDGAQRATTQRNMAAVLEYVNFERPQASLFLVKALSAHGSSSATQWPIKGRQAVPFRMMEAWVEHVAINNPHLKGSNMVASAPVFMREPPSSPPQLPAVAAQPLVKKSADAKAAVDQPGVVKEAPPPSAAVFEPGVPAPPAQFALNQASVAPLMKPPSTAKKASAPLVVSTPQSGTGVVTAQHTIPGAAQGVAHAEQAIDDPFDAGAFNQQFFGKR